MSRNPHPGRSPRRLVAAAALLAMLAGCSEKDTLSDVVVHAGDQMSAAAGNGVSMPPAEMRQQTYDSVIATLRGALKGHDAEPGAASAKLLIAQALMGQGDLAAERAGEARRALLYQIAQTRSRVDLQARRGTLANAYANHDTSSDLKQLDDSQGAISQEASELRATLADKQKRIETLQAQMDAEKEQAEKLVAEASKLRNEAADAGAVQRADLIKRANEIERDADAHEKKCSEIQLNVQTLEDESEEVRIRISSAEHRQELVQEARQRIESSAKLLETQSSEAQTDAQNIASEVGGLFDTLMQSLEQTEMPAYEEAVGKYREAASQAQQARDEVAGSAPAVAALAQHASAGLALAQADLLENMMLLAQGLGAQLGSSRFAEAATTLEQQMKDARSQAAELYESAGNTYARLNLGGGDSLQELSAQFQDFAGQLRGQAPQAPEPDENAAPEEPAPDASGADASGDEGTTPPNGSDHSETPPDASDAPQGD